MPAPTRRVRRQLKLHVFATGFRGIVVQRLCYALLCSSLAIAASDLSLESCRMLKIQKFEKRKTWRKVFREAKRFCAEFLLDRTGWRWPKTAAIIGPTAPQPGLCKPFQHFPVSGCIINVTHAHVDLSSAACLVERCTGTFLKECLDIFFHDHTVEYAANGSPAVEARTAE